MAKARLKTNLVEVAVDSLGEVRAQIAVLKKEAKQYEAILKNSGCEVIEGDYFRATVSRHDRVCPDYKAICAKLKASDYMYKTYSKTSHVCKLVITAHKK